MKNYSNWQEIDNDTNGLVTSLTYIALFLNDQVYNSSIDLYENCKITPYYRHGVKKTRE